jgi:hypothetical protein
MWPVVAWPRSSARRALGTGGYGRFGGAVGLLTRRVGRCAQPTVAQVQHKFAAEREDVRFGQQYDQVLAQLNQANQRTSGRRRPGTTAILAAMRGGRQASPPPRSKRAVRPRRLRC